VNRKYAGRQLPQLLRDEIERQRLTQYAIARETGIKQPSLSRFLNGGSLKIETAALLLDYLGYELVER
jgi:transcriptional regulator with XRE-family HTH domain